MPLRGTRSDSLPTPIATPTPSTCRLAIAGCTPRAAAPPCPAVTTGSASRVVPRLPVTHGRRSYAYILSGPRSPPCSLGLCCCGLCVPGGTACVQADTTRHRPLIPALPAGPALLAGPVAREYTVARLARRCRGSRPADPSFCGPCWQAVPFVAWPLVPRALARNAHGSLLLARSVPRRGRPCPHRDQGSARRVRARAAKIAYRGRAAGLPGRRCLAGLPPGRGSAAAGAGAYGPAPPPLRPRHPGRTPQNPASPSLTAPWLTVASPT